MLKLFVSALILISTFSARAQSSGGSWWSGGYDFTQRASNREKGRWSLSEWMQQKERNHMMDMWLSMNSPSPFELMLGGSYISYKTDLHDGTDPSSHISSSGEVSAYAQLVGLTGEYENNAQENFNSLAGMLNIRLLGNSIQNTYLTVHYGQRTVDMSGTTSTRLSQQFAQASLQLYVTRFFGLDGHYRYYIPVTNDVLGDVKESETQAGAFLDFGPLRIFGAWYSDMQNLTAASTALESKVERTGIRSGLKIFF